MMQRKRLFFLTLNKMTEKQKSTGKEMFVGVNRVLSDAESKSFFEEYRAEYPKMDIKIPFLTVRGNPSVQTCIECVAGDMSHSGSYCRSGYS